MVSTPLRLANLKLLSVVNSDLQRTGTAALLYAACFHLCLHVLIRAPGFSNQLQYIINRLLIFEYAWPGDCGFSLKSSKCVSPPFVCLS